jgi:hypothetical protein
MPYAGRDPLDAAVLLAESIDSSDALDVLVHGVCAAFACDWSTVLDIEGSTARALAEAGEPPTAAWLGAFVAGARARLSLSATDGIGLVGPRDIAWAPLDSSDFVLVAGRDGPPFRSRERLQLQQLCRIADARWGEFVRNGARTAHPSALDRPSRPRLAVS